MGVCYLFYGSNLIMRDVRWRRWLGDVCMWVNLSYYKWDSVPINL